MRFNKTFAVAAGAAAVLAFASAVAAQTPPAAPRPAVPAAPRPAAPAAAPIAHGPAIPGLCYYSFDAVFANSDLGKAVAARLGVIAKVVETELTTEDKALAADFQAFERARPTMTPDAVEQRGSLLTVRRSALVRKAELRQRELQATQGKAVNRVEQEMIPVVLATYQARGCSLLLGNGMVLGNPAMDISSQVVTGLNARIKTLTFERERLDVPPPAAPGTPAAPAAPAAPPRTN